jgi:hypothetical protein
MEQVIPMWEHGATSWTQRWLALHCAAYPDEWCMKCGMDIGLTGSGDAVGPHGWHM